MKRIKDDSLSILAEAMTPSQYRKFKKLYEGKLANITRRLKTTMDNNFKKACDAENPTYLSNEEVDELTQEFIDKCRNLKDKAGRGIRRGKDAIQKGYKRAKDFWEKEVEDITSKPNPLYIDDDDDEDSIW